VGSAFVVVAVVWMANYKQLVTRFYERSRKAWDTTPGTGRLYGRVVTAGQFKVLGFFGAFLFGLVFVAWGIALIAEV
jgi:hypothetical protein